MERFYKLAQPDGWDFYTGNTINYRDNIGKVVRRRNLGKIKLCSDNCLHASRDPNQAFIGAKIPCSVYLVEGKAINEDSSKAGFKQLGVLEELNPIKVFKWRYEEACNPVHPFKIKPPKITQFQIDLLKRWDSVGTSVWDSVGTSVWDSVRDSVGYSVRDSVGYSVCAYTGWIFSPCVSNWKHIDHKPGEYPFQPAIDLWMQGIVPGFDGEVWRLYGKDNAEILWKGKLKKQ